MNYVCENTKSPDAREKRTLEIMEYPASGREARLVRVVRLGSPEVARFVAGRLRTVPALLEAVARALPPGGGSK